MRQKIKISVEIFIFLLKCSTIEKMQPGHLVILDKIIIDWTFRGGESRQPRDHRLTGLPVGWSAVSSSWFFQSEYPGFIFLLKIEMVLELALHLVWWWSACWVQVVRSSPWCAVVGGGWAGKEGREIRSRGDWGWLRGHSSEWQCNCLGGFDSKAFFQSARSCACWTIPGWACTCWPLTPGSWLWSSSRSATVSHSISSSTGYLWSCACWEPHLAGPALADLWHQVHCRDRLVGRPQ